MFLEKHSYLNLVISFFKQDIPGEKKKQSFKRILTRFNE